MPQTTIQPLVITLTAGGGVIGVPRSQFQGSAVKSCQRCGRKFNIMFRWRRNCFVCGGAFCSACTRNKSARISGYESPQRVCVGCSGEVIRLLRRQDLAENLGITKQPSAKKPPPPLDVTDEDCKLEDEDAPSGCGTPSAQLFDAFRSKERLTVDSSSDHPYSAASLVRNDQNVESSCVLLDDTPQDDETVPFVVRVLLCAPDGGPSVSELTCSVLPEDTAGCLVNKLARQFIELFASRRGRRVLLQDAAFRKVQDDLFLRASDTELPANSRLLVFKDGDIPLELHHRGPLDPSAAPSPETSQNMFSAEFSVGVEGFDSSPVLVQSEN